MPQERDSQLAKALFLREAAGQPDVHASALQPLLHAATKHLDITGRMVSDFLAVTPSLQVSPKQGMQLLPWRFAVAKCGTR